MALQLKLFGEDLLGLDGEPHVNKYETHISGGSILFRYLGLENLLTYINISYTPDKSPFTYLLCSPFSYEIDIRLHWTGDQNLATKEGKLDTLLMDCFISDARFIVITLHLDNFINFVGHANYILIDKGISIDNLEMTAIRIEPHGFCATSDIYNPEKLDKQLEVYLNQFANKITYGSQQKRLRLLTNEAYIATRGPQTLEIRERTESKLCKIIPNRGLCTTHSFLMIYLFFEIITKKLPVNFFLAREYGINPTYIDIGQIQGEDLFTLVFNQMNMQFTYPGDEVSQWLEKLAITLNQLITQKNTLLLTQLFELSAISGGPLTRKGTQADPLIDDLLRTRQNIPPGTCATSETDSTMGAAFTRMMINSRLTSEELDEIFTIYGINYEVLYQYVRRAQAALQGGRRKTKKRKQRRRKTKRRKQRRRKTKRRKQRRNKTKKEDLIKLKNVKH